MFIANLNIVPAESRKIVCPSNAFNVMSQGELVSENVGFD